MPYLRPQQNMTEPVPPEPKPAKAAAPAADPGAASVWNFMLYGASLPERMLRSGAGVAAGALIESSALLVPRAFRDSKTYTVFVKQMLDFMAEDVGGVNRKPAPLSEPEAAVENFVARKTVGNFVEMAGMMTLHLSPITVLAIMADVAYGSQTYLKELSAELKKHGVIDQDSTIDHVDDLLSAVAATAGASAEAFNTPPLSIVELQKTVAELRTASATADPTRIIPQAEINRLWKEMRDVAAQEKVGLLEVSTGMALFSLEKVGHVAKGAYATLCVTGSLLDRHIFDHYRDALGEIHRVGLYQTIAETSEPYIAAVYHNFSSERSTITEDVLSGKLIGQAWTSVRRWLVGEAPPEEKNED